jgi:Mg2+-importing ATPase
LTQLQSSERGLSGEEARRRQRQWGPNEPAPKRRAGDVWQLLLPFINPLALVLLNASAVSAYMGEVVNASIIVTIVILGGGINFIQSYRSRRAVERLRASVAPTAAVLRDANWSERPRKDLVPGDIIRLVAGDLVPADARLLHAKDLYVQEAALTGESMPAEKEAENSPAKDRDSGNTRLLVFLGTSVVSGTATAIVVATGRATAFGDIAARLAARAPETEFDRGIRKFGFFIMQTIVLLVSMLFLINALLGRDPLQSLLFSVALAVGLTPEFLPMITSVTLAQGVVRLARRKVIVKHLAAMQNFGSIDVLCSDKTGTLTKGEMVLDQRFDPLGASSEKVFQLAYLNSHFETGIRSPFDTAILAQGKPDICGFSKVDEIPFDFERRRLSIVVERGEQRMLISKGAPEGILPCCAKYEIGGMEHALDAQARATCEAQFRKLSSLGYRILAVAYRQVPASKAYQPADETDLVLAGYLTFFDPPLADTAETLEDLRQDGVRVMILTGDNDLLAKHVCAQVGLDSSAVVLGKEIVQMTDPALGQIAERTQLFARVSPAQKNRIMEALRRRGHVVGFLGDGINDAPSLHSADVGISVAGAVDVAKDAAEIILMEPGLKILHSGIWEGRRAFGNVMKYLLMGTSSNFGNVFSMAAASLFLPFLPMLPMQVLLKNFLYDLSQVTIPTDNVDDSFTHKPKRWDISLIRKFMVYVGPISSLYDLLTFWALIAVFHASEPLFHTGWFVESLATQTLVILVIRTGGNPFLSRPSNALFISVCTVVLIGLLLPYSQLAGVLGFVPMLVGYLVFLVVVIVTYLLLVEWAKRRLLAKLFQ